MRQRTLFLFREFKNNAVFRIAYIVYFLLTVAVLAYALLNMLAGLSVDKFLYGVQIILLASLLHFIFYSLISYEFCCSDQAVGIDEFARTIENGKSRLLLSKIVVLMSLTIPNLILNIIVTVIGAIVGHVGAALLQILGHLILNLAVLPAVGILFGAVLACGAKRGAAYIIMAAATFLSSPIVLALQFINQRAFPPAY